MKPQIYYRGRFFKMPTHLISEHQLVISATGLAIFGTLDSEMSIYFPLATHTDLSEPSELLVP